MKLHIKQIGDKHYPVSDDFFLRKSPMGRGFLTNENEIGSLYASNTYYAKDILCAFISDTIKLDNFDFESIDFTVNNVTPPVEMQAEIKPLSNENDINTTSETPVEVLTAQHEATKDENRPDGVVMTPDTVEQVSGTVTEDIITDPIVVEEAIKPKKKTKKEETV